MNRYPLSYHSSEMNENDFSNMGTLRAQNLLKFASNLGISGTFLTESEMV